LSVSERGKTRKIIQRGLSILNAGFVASVPAICGFVGGVLGGVISDAMLRKGYSITAARKTPIVGGMLLATSLIICNYVDAYWLVILGNRATTLLVKACRLNWDRPEETILNPSGH